VKTIVSVGDVVEVATSKGLAYAQCSQDHPRYGHLVRILPGFYKKSPVDLQRLIDRKESLLVFFQLHAAVKIGLFRIVARCPVPDPVKDLRVFRTGFQDQLTKVVKEWWLWDGQGEQRLDPLSNSQAVPIPEVWLPGLLIEDIESGWIPDEDHLRLAGEKARMTDEVIPEELYGESASIPLQLV
jgi:hypothetical protein